MYLQFRSSTSIIAVFTLLVFIASCKKEEKQRPTPESKYQQEILVGAYPQIFSGDLTRGELQIWDYNGNIIRKKALDGALMNFQRWIINGHVRYTYIEFDPVPYRMYGVGYIPGPAVILDSAFNEIKRVRLAPFNNSIEPSPNSLDGHDFILLDDNHYFVMAYYERRVNNIPAYLHPIPDCRVVAPIIQEIKDDRVVWEWDGTNYPELYENSVEGNDYSIEGKINDYAHINSMFIDPKDGNLILSFRNINQVLKVSRTNGDIIWRLGGKSSDYAMTDDQKFLAQHHATYIDNETILLFDNGVLNVRPYTRILEIKLDENSKRITGFKSTLLRGVFARYMGSVQKIGNRYFVGCGSEPRIMEISAENGEVFFERKVEGNTYRAFKY